MIGSTLQLLMFLNLKVSNLLHRPILRAQEPVASPASAEANFSSKSCQWWAPTIRAV